MIEDLPGIVFDRESIRVLVPNERPCVYWLYDADGGLVYFGASKDPRTRLLAHRRDIRRAKATIVRLKFFRTTTAMARAELQQYEIHKALGGNMSELCGVIRRNKDWKAQNRV